MLQEVQGSCSNRPKTVQVFQIDVSNVAGNIVLSGCIALGITTSEVSRPRAREHPKPTLNPPRSNYLTSALTTTAAISATTMTTAVALVFFAVVEALTANAVVIGVAEITAVAVRPEVKLFAVVAFVAQ